MPLGHLGQKRQHARRRLVQRLEWRAAPHAVVDASRAPAEKPREAGAVDAARPAHVSRPVVLLGPFALQHRLGAPVADLLPPVGAQRVPAVVPHQGGGVEAERPAALQQPPAHVDVVPGGAELRIESADRLEAAFPERHVAAGDVLGLAIVQQHVDGTARRARHALGDRAVAGRRDVGPAHARVGRAHERGREIPQPLRIGPRIVVDVRDDLAGRRREAGVPRVGQPAVRRLDQDRGVPVRDRGGRVPRSVVDNDDLVVGVVEAGEPVETVADRARPVVRAHDDRNAGPMQARRERHVVERLAHRVEAELR